MHSLQAHMLYQNICQYCPKIPSKLTAPQEFEKNINLEIAFGS
jgi:hypothetical protein